MKFLTFLSSPKRCEIPDIPITQSPLKSPKIGPKPRVGLPLWRPMTSDDNHYDFLNSWPLHKALLFVKISEWKVTATPF